MGTISVNLNRPRIKMHNTVKIFLLCLSLISTAAYSKTLHLAVGPDHQAMLSKQYDFYAANWLFINKSLNSLGHQVIAHSMPWARAKQQVEAGELDGLFLAANLNGRNQWAHLTDSLGSDYFGFFTKPDAYIENKFIGAVRLGGDKLLSHINPEQLIEVTTAQKGLTLLAENKIAKFVMSESYGDYLLNTELKAFSNAIYFEDAGSERRTSHIAISKTHSQAEDILALYNQAIRHGIKKGIYTEAMNKYKIPQKMRVE